MGWILIPLAIAGIAGLSGGQNDCGYDACAVPACAPVAQYAPAPSYGYHQGGGQGYAAPANYYGGQSAYGHHQQQIGYASQGNYGQQSYGAHASYNGADFSTGAQSY